MLLAAQPSFPLKDPAAPVSKGTTLAGIKKFVTNNLPTDVVIETVEGGSDDVALMFSADTQAQMDKFLACLTIAKKSGVLTIDYRFPKKGTNVFSSGMNLDNNPKLNVRISRATPLDLGASYGKWSVGDTLAPFKARLGGCGSMKTGVLQAGAQIVVSGTANFSAKGVVGQALDVDISGTSRTSIAYAEVGTSSLKLSGSGGIGVQDGVVKETLTAGVYGAGGISFGGTAGAAVLELFGSGNINIANVSGKIEKRCIGSGYINVRNKTNIPNPKPLAGIKRLKFL